MHSESSTAFSPIVGSTNDVELAQLRNQRIGTYPTDATVTVTVKDATGAIVAGANALAMPYVAADRIYRGVLPASLPLAVGASYTRIVTAVDADGNTRVFSKTGTAVAG